MNNVLNVGMISKMIDDFKARGLIQSSWEDFALGLMYGWGTGFYGAFSGLYLQREPSEAEMTEFWGMLERRIKDVLSKLKTKYD